MISAGEVAGSSNVVILDDDVIEMNENFIISIAGVDGNAVANPTMSTVTVTIEDNDIGKARKLNENNIYEWDTYTLCRQYRK